MVVLKKVLVFLIRFYMKNISPALPARCRYYPTCSRYTLDAIEIYGPIKGTVLGIFRFLRCNPLFKGGYDPVINHNHCRKIKDRGSH